MSGSARSYVDSVDSWEDVPCVSSLSSINGALPGTKETRTRPLPLITPPQDASNPNHAIHTSARGYSPQRIPTADHSHRGRGTDQQTARPLSYNRLADTDITTSTHRGRETRTHRERTYQTLEGVLSPHYSPLLKHRTNFTAHAPSEIRERSNPAFAVLSRGVSPVDGVASSTSDSNYSRSDRDSSSAVRSPPQSDTDYSPHSSPLMPSPHQSHTSPPSDYILSAIAYNPAIKPAKTSQKREIPSTSLALLPATTYVPPTAPPRARHTSREYGEIPIILELTKPFISEPAESEHATLAKSEYTPSRIISLYASRSIHHLSDTSIARATYALPPASYKAEPHCDASAPTHARTHHAPFGTLATSTITSQANHTGASSYQQIKRPDPTTGYTTSSHYESPHQQTEHRTIYTSASPPPLPPRPIIPNHPPRQQNHDPSHDNCNNTVHRSKSTKQPWIVHTNPHREYISAVWEATHTPEYLASKRLEKKSNEEARRMLWRAGRTISKGLKDWLADASRRKEQD